MAERRAFLRGGGAGNRSLPDVFSQRGEVVRPSPRLRFFRRFRAPDNSFPVPSDPPACARILEKLEKEGGVSQEAAKRSKRAAIASLVSGRWTTAAGPLSAADGGAASERAMKTKRFLISGRAFQSRR